MQLCGAVAWRVPNGVLLKAANRSRSCRGGAGALQVCWQLFCFVLFVSFARAKCEALLMGEQKNKDTSGRGSRPGLLLNP